MSLYIASFDQLMTSSARSFSKGEGCFHNMSEKKPIIPPFEKVGLGGIYKYNYLLYKRFSLT